MLLLAPDTEESDVLDSKIADMLAEAREKEIPVVYSLKRRPLGKAAGVTMKQSVVSVCNIDGAEKQFKALVELIGYCT
jgi:ribosomal protein L7Ae-like RNA K-turn-binding protein